MSLTPGTRLGPYEIQSPLGAGGMGEVYRARDTRLERTVALKVLPPQFAADPERRSRFEREARVIATLSHPHICVVHDVGADYIVMELLDGETLEARLARENGPLPMAQVLRIGREIADALDKAHRAAIVHRDLKPANIMLTKTGAKLLDFGLAKLQPSAVPISISATEQGTAETGPGTTAGTLLGTVPYMAPEQVEGREADARSDVWALGVVLYEMATGQRPFQGESAASIIGAILKDVPPAVSSTVPSAPAALDHVIADALAKDPDDRWQSSADVAKELRWLGDSRGAGAAASTGRAWSWGAAAGWVVALIATGLLIVRWLQPSASARSESIRFDVLPPAGTAFSMPGDVSAAWPVVSPDGSRIVFPAAAPGGPPQLWVRRLDTTETIALRGTEGATFPFWAPDSQRIGYFAADKLRVIDLSGGAPRALADVEGGAQARGGSWNGEETIIFTKAQVSGLTRVQSDGSGLASVTTLNTAAGETSHRWPSFLPNGRGFVYTIRGQAASQGIHVRSLEGTLDRRLVPDLSNAAVDPSGFLLFTRAGALVAQPFDLERLEVSGTALPVVPRVAFSPSYYNGAFSVSRTGILAFGPGPVPTQLQWMNRRGEVQTRVGPTGEYLHPKPSPDDSKIAVARMDGELSNYDLWIIDGSRGDSMARLTFDAASERFPSWSPDGGQIAFSSQGPRGLSDIMLKRSSGVGDERLVVDPSRADLITSFAQSWTPDGKRLVFSGQHRTTHWDVDIIDVDTGRVSTFLGTPFVEVQPQLSSDGRWIAYASDESGRFEVYVRPFPSGDTRWPVSTAGGQQPRWRADGQELYFLAPDSTLMSVAVKSAPSFERGLPVPLFRLSVAELAPQFGRDFAVSRDGQRFLVNWVPDERASATIVVNWTAPLKALALRSAPSR